MSEQLPILCRRCGGAAQLLDAQNIECMFCRARDQLPADAVLRNIELRSRLEAARAASAQLDGFAMAMARMYEGKGGMLRALLPITLFCGFILFSVVSRVGEYATEELQWCLLLNSLASSALLWMLPLGMTVGILLARYRYRTRVRPLLLARSPTVPGAPARCRVCAGPLDTTNAAEFCTCRYCHTPNLLVGEVFTDRVERLAQEQASYHARATGASAAAVSMGMSLSNLLTIIFVASWISGIVLTGIVQRTVCGW